MQITSRKKPLLQFCLGDVTDLCQGQGNDIKKDTPYDSVQTMPPPFPYLHYRKLYYSRRAPLVTSLGAANKVLILFPLLIYL